MKGLFPYTPPTNLLYGLREALRMLDAEGMSNVFARHDRHADATRRAVHAWGLELLCLDDTAYSSSITAVMTPEGYDANTLIDAVLDRFDMSLGIGLTKLAGKVFRIGHLGDFNDLSLLGTLARRRDGPRPCAHSAPGGRGGRGDDAPGRLRAACPDRTGAGVAAGPR